VRYVAPRGGKKEGACRTAHGGRGETTEFWGIDRSTCEARCSESLTCIAYEWDWHTHVLDKCELHAVPITHVLPKWGGGAVCLVKEGAAAASALAAADDPIAVTVAREVRFTTKSYNLQVTSYKLQVTSYRTAVKRI